MKLSCALIFSSLALTAADTPVFWRDPGAVPSLDMAAGPGGKPPRPPFQFVEEEKGGTSAKVRVKDAAGSEWILKFGEEVKAETFASRIVWAAGFFAEPTYFVKEGKLEGVGELGRAKQFIQGGHFQDARFELRGDGPRDKGWNLGDSKFKGSRELAALRVMFILLSNWDVKPQNLAAIETNGEWMYGVTDWGASMGRPAELMGRSKWDCNLYAADSRTFIEGVDNGFVVFNFQAKQGEEIRRNIKVDDVQWLMQRLGKLSDAQIDAALQASGATAEEKACFAPAFRSRLRQLTAVSKSTVGQDDVSETRREVKVTKKEQ